MLHRVILNIYTLGIHIGNLYVFIGSFFSRQLKLMYIGRKTTLSTIKEKTENKVSCIWIHCASLGEFEQGRPVLEALKKNYPHKKLVLSFFSPSGFEIRKNYKIADHIFYLPSDLPSNNKLLISHFKPEIFILVKYEFWWNLINELSYFGCKIYLISGIFRKNDYFFNSPLQVLKNVLKKFEILFVQDAESAAVLSKNKIAQYQLSGDTRIDRVIENTLENVADDKISDFIHATTTIVYGSIWLSDMHIVKAICDNFPEFRHIIVPHDIESKNLNSICRIVSVFNLYSDEIYSNNILIINNIGMLSKLYSYAKYAYIGGGFNSGIHNTLEPTVFGIPVFFGPKYSKFNEAVAMCDIGCAFPILRSEVMIEKLVHLENNVQDLENIKYNLKNYFEKNKGATAKIIGHLSRFLK